MPFLRAISLSLIVGFTLVSWSASAAPVGEIEPNDTPGDASTLLPGLSGVGSINAGPEFDVWQLKNLTQQHANFVYLATAASTTGGDSVLSVFPGNAPSLDTADASFYNDDGGPRGPVAFSSSTINGFTAPSNGTMLLRIDGFGSTTLTPYEVFHASLLPGDFAEELEPNDSAASAMEVVTPGVRALGGDDADYYTFFAGAGDRIVVMLQNSLLFDASAPVESFFHSRLEILGTDGATVLSTEATYSAAKNQQANSNTAGPVVAPTSGKYFVRVLKQAGENRPYRFALLVEGDAVRHGACCFGVGCELRSNINCFGTFMGVGTSCNGDQDGDGIVDDCDNCAITSNPGQEDTDFDGAGNLCETCVDDPLKFAAGQCGCGAVDVDGDSDGIADCIDLCPVDVAKSVPGACGCGVVDTDANQNGVADCLVGADIEAQVRQAIDSLSLLKRLRSSATKRAKQKAKVRIQEIRALLDEVKERVSTSGAGVSVASPEFNLVDRAAILSKAVSKTLRFHKRAKFNALKRRAIAEGNAFLEGVL